MSKVLKEWTVLPHGALNQVEKDLLTVVGDLPMPLGTFPRRMTVVRLRDSQLVIFSAIALHEPEMLALEAWGRPTYLIVPSDIHRNDAKIWKDRYPQLFVVTPEGARDKVAEVVRVDATSVDFPDPNVRFITVPGTEGHEAALVVKTESGTTVVVNDLIWNVDDRPGFGGWLFRLAGFTGSEPKIPAFVAMKAIKDKPSLKAQLEQWAAVQGVNRIIVSHGDIVTQDAPQVLRGLAESLAA